MHSLDPKLVTPQGADDILSPAFMYVVRDFNADVSLAPASVSLYLAGGMALQWLLGPLSDRIGRRPV
ncbi:hypothetical protein ONK27_26965, partial [Salmonella enterica subsp. enterica serovar Virginia]|nr:hypothetical protein [Salmonella enterica subsp. enterica serovar Virginia]